MGDADPLQSITLVDVKELCKRLAISRRQCFRLSALREVGLSTFPKAVRLGRRCVRWRVADVERYLDSLLGGEGK